MELPMTNQMNLKEAERKAFRLATSQDGLYDTFIGIFIILLSAMPWLDENGLRTPWNVILVEGIGIAVLLGVLGIKKFVVAPRIGRVDYGVQRKIRMKRLALAMSAIFIVTLIMVAMTVSAIYYREPIFTGSVRWNFELDLVHTAAGVFIFALFSIIGYMNDNPRMYFYGALFGLGYIISTYIQDQTGDPFYWPQAIAGTLVAIIGLVVFARFLQKYRHPSFTGLH
jgi:hypothetical protein